MSRSFRQRYSFSIELRPETRFIYPGETSARTSTSPSSIRTRAVGHFLARQPRYTIPLNGRRLSTRSRNGEMHLKGQMVATGQPRTNLDKLLHFMVKDSEVTRTNKATYAVTPGKIG